MDPSTPLYHSLAVADGPHRPHRPRYSLAGLGMALAWFMVAFALTQVWTSVTQGTEISAWAAAPATMSRAPTIVSARPFAAPRQHTVAQAASRRPVDEEPTPPTDLSSDLDHAPLSLERPEGRRWDPIAETLGKGAVLGVSLPGLGQVFDLSGPASVLQALLVVAGIIIIHELGHFTAARLQNIRVSRFSIGMGPPIWEYQGPQVKYSVSAILTGGFVAFPDDDPDSGIPKDDPDLLRNRPIKDRMLVTCAGVIANLVLAYAILFAQTSQSGLDRVNYLQGVKAFSITPESPAARAGIQENDIIMAINGQEVGECSAERVRWLQTQIKQSPAKEVELVIKRQELPLQTVRVTPNVGTSTGMGIIGTSLRVNYQMEKDLPKDAMQTASWAWTKLYKLTNSVVGGFASLFSGKTSSAELSGPIKIISMGSQVARDDGSDGLYRFAASLNVNLAVLNVLPLPGLDGGAFLLLLIEAARGKKLPGDTEKLIQGGGFLVFASFGLYILFKDALDVLPF